MKFYPNSDFSTKAFSVSVLVTILSLASTYGCTSLTTPEIEPASGNRIVFRRMYTQGFPLVIDVLESNQIRWFMKPDAAGGGRICTEDEDFECLVVGGMFVFAIPRLIASDSWPGDHWTFQDQRFEIYNASPEFFGRQEGWKLVVETRNEMGWFLFNYDAETGLEYVTLIDGDWEREYEGSPYIPVLEVVYRVH